MTIKDVKSAEEPFSDERAWTILKTLADNPSYGAQVSQLKQL